MRKLILLTMAFVYLASTTGMALQWHYCMGQLKDVQVGLQADHHVCGACGMTMGDNECCKDEQTSSRVSDSHQGITTFYHWMTTDSQVSTVYLAITSYLPHSDPAVYLTAHSPPLISPRAQAFLCVFRC